MKKAFLILALISLPFTYAVASTDIRFFSLIPDMPIMAGLQELQDQSFGFDKPEGRFVETLSYLREGTPQQVSAYYHETLAQLGWRSLAQDIYIREQERMTINFERQDEIQLIRITIEPR